MGELCRGCCWTPTPWQQCRQLGLPSSVSSGKSPSVRPAPWMQAQMAATTTTLTRQTMMTPMGAPAARAGAQQGAASAGRQLQHRPRPTGRRPAGRRSTTGTHQGTGRQDHNSSRPHNWQQTCMPLTAAASESTTQVCRAGQNGGPQQRAQDGQAVHSGRGHPLRAADPAREQPAAAAQQVPGGKERVLEAVRGYGSGSVTTLADSLWHLVSSSGRGGDQISFLLHCMRNM